MARPKRYSTLVVTKGVSLPESVWRTVAKIAKQRGYNGHSRYIANLIRKDLKAEWPEERDKLDRYRRLD